MAIISYFPGGTGGGGATGTVITDLPYQDGELYYDGSEQTPTWGNYDPEIMVVAFGTQSATDCGTYSTYFYLAPGYIWPDGKSWLKVKWEIIETRLDYVDWDFISEVTNAGKASAYWAVGDMKAVTLNGTVGDLDFSNETYYAYIIGFDHNAALETSGNHSLTMQFGCLKDATSIAFIDSIYDSLTTYPPCGFQMSWDTSYLIVDTNSGGWNECNIRQNICPEFYNALPSTLQDVICTTTKYTDNTGNSSNKDYNVTKTNDQIFLLAEYEVSGKRECANDYEKDYQKQYDYYVKGYSGGKYKHSETSEMCCWWTRSAGYDSKTSFVIVNDHEIIQCWSANNSLGFAPAFCITG